jgi:hypothetical protein
MGSGGFYQLVQLRLKDQGLKPAPAMRINIPSGVIKDSALVKCVDSAIEEGVLLCSTSRRCLLQETGSLNLG